MKDYGADVTTAKASTGTPTTADIKEMVARINQKIGLAIKETTDTNTEVAFYS